jgi:nucleotide-binding universal stress UspA family protein
MNRVLVPLDGSQTAEGVLSHVQQFASRSNAAEITLLHVKPEGRPDSEGKTDWNYLGDGEDIILTYLGLAGSLVDTDASVTAKVRFGRPAEQIIEQAREDSVDFIAMTSHGRTGAFGSRFGPVAEAVLHSSPAPVLMVPDATRLLGQKPLQGPLAYRCGHCGRRTYRATISLLDRCGHCHSYLKSPGTRYTLTG